MDRFVASLLAMTGEAHRPHSLFNILNTPLAMAIQRLSTVTSAVMKIRLRVAHHVRLRYQDLADLAGLDEMRIELHGREHRLSRHVSRRHAAGAIRERHQLPALHQAAAVMVLVLRYNSCSPLTTRCHSGPTRLMNPLVSTRVQPEALSFAVALSVMSFLSPSNSVVPAKAGTHNHRCPLVVKAVAPAFPNINIGGYGSRLALRLAGTTSSIISSNAEVL